MNLMQDFYQIQVGKTVVVLVQVKVILTVRKTNQLDLDLERGRVPRSAVSRAKPRVDLGLQEKERHQCCQEIGLDLVVQVQDLDLGPLLGLRHKQHHGER